MFLVGAASLSAWQSAAGVTSTSSQFQPTGCGSGASIMIGNSEVNDIQPAVALGMRVLRVAIEEPAPRETAAHAVAISLEQAAAVLRNWWR